MNLEELTSLEKLTALCKRRGFIYSSSAIYGGLQGFFDYGPLGVELKNNIKKSWWEENVYLRSDVYGLDASLILNQNVVKFSGHADTFTDNLIDCKDCKCRFRDDELVNNKCYKCGSSNLSDSRAFNLMMNVNLGPTNSVNAVLRPETAQSIFINFKNVCDSFSPKIPFGIAQIGKAFRNEITPRNFIFRMREFEQMELEYFVQPSFEDEMFEYWINQRILWWNKIGVTNIKKKEQTKEELSHYSSATTDLIFEFPHGWEELEGIANRGDFDLSSHTKAQNEFEIKSKVIKNTESVDKLCYSNAQTKAFIPSIIESSAGLDRAFLAVLTSAYCKEQISENDERIVLKFLPRMAPIKVAVIPLAKNNAEIVLYAKNLFDKLKQEKIFPVVLESGGNIGKCYRKHDEIGTPFAITIDFETLNELKDTITVRFRDSMEQKRMHVNDLIAFLKEELF